MKAPAFLRNLDREIRQQELRRFIRSVALIEALLLVIVAAYCALAPETVREPRSVIFALAVFGLLCCLFRVRPLFPRQTRLKLAAECWTMMLFTTFVLWQTGGVSSALLSLFLLPIIVSALALGRVMTLIQVIGVCGLYAAVVMGQNGVATWSNGEIAGALARLAPLMLVAFLTSMLAADVFAARRRIESLAQTDSLTGLLNIRTFNEHFRHAHTQAQLDEQAYTVLMVDMDHLKVINDDYGHEAGNAAIVLVANCIRRTVRASDIAARFGGDEFIVLLSGVDIQGAEAIAQRLRNLVFNTTLDVGSRMIRSSVSIGMASFPRDGREGRELMTLADRRMYRDKELRRRPATVATARS